MARKERKEEREQQNGLAQDATFFSKEDREAAYEQLRNLQQTAVGNPQLLGWSAIALGGILLLYSFGMFEFLNYIIGAIAVGLIAYGALKIRAMAKVRAFADQIQEYFDNNTANSKSRSKKKK